jgi:outer membrane cobalamin receptor
MDPSTPQGTFDATLFQPNFIDTVEIIQGEQTTEFGAYGAGTVINIHTKSRDSQVGVAIGSPQTRELLGYTTTKNFETANGSIYNLFVGASSKSGFTPSMVLDSHKNYPSDNLFLFSKVNFSLNDESSEINERTEIPLSAENPKWNGSLQFLNSSRNQNLGESGVDLNLFSSTTKSQILQFRLENFLSAHLRGDL